MSGEYNTQPQGLEKWVDETLNKNFPVQLPTGAKKWLGDNAWWLALIGGILSLLGALNFWNAAHYVSYWSRVAQDLYGVNTGANVGLFWWVALVAMIAQGVLLLMSVQKLKAHLKDGWNLLFYSSLISVVVGVLYVLVPSYGISSLIGTLIGTVIGWWLLFQFRSQFTK